MNTPAHLLIGAALFGKRDNIRLLGGALLGGLLPDVSLYLLAGFSIFILNISPNVVFGELYFSDTWQTIFSIDNSFFVWGILLAIAIKSQSKFFIALTTSAVLHVVSDFALHHDDARAHLWPLSDWRFESPISYWDSNHHAFYVIPVEGILCAIATVYLLAGKLHIAVKVGLVLLFMAELFTLSSWLRYF